MMEGPLANLDDRAARASRTVRLITLDLSGAEPRLDGIYVYLTEAAEQVGTRQQDEIKIGDLTSLSPTRLLVAERDSAEGGGYKAIFRVDLDGASNLLGQTTSGRSSSSSTRAVWPQPASAQ